MKNLLVEALRQAGQSGESPAKGDEPPAEAVPQPTADPNSAATEVIDPDSELALIEDGTVDSTDAELTDVAPEVSSDSLEVSEQPDDGSEQEGSLSNQPTLSYEAEAEPSVASGGDLDSVTSAATARPDLLLRAGRLSPLLYALTVTAAAASLSGYQRLNKDDMSMELGLMPDRPVEVGTVPTPREGWLALAAQEVAEEQPPPLENHGGAKAATGERQSTPASADRWTTSASATPVQDPALSDVRDAYEDYRRGAYAEAEVGYQLALTKDPYHLHGLLGLAAVYERTERHEAAHSLYRRVLSAHPTNADAASRLIASIRRSGPMEAETRLKLLVQQYGDTPSIRTALGSLLAEQNRWPEAYEAFSIALALQPEDADAHYNVAVSAERVGRLDSAQEHYAAALSAASSGSAFNREEVESRMTALSQLSGGRP